jgi:uncharacterized ion transporter superfamily protein YfcC
MFRSPVWIDPPSISHGGVVDGLAIAKVGYDKYLRFLWPLLVGLLVVAAAGVAIAGTLA